MIGPLLAAWSAAWAAPGPVGAELQAFPDGGRIGARFALPVERDEGTILLVSGRAATSWFDLRGAGIALLDGSASLGWLARDRVLRLDGGSIDWNFWGYELSGSRRATVLRDRPGPMARISLSIRLPRAADP